MQVKQQLVEARKKDPQAQLEEVETLLDRIFYVKSEPTRTDYEAFFLLQNFPMQNKDVLYVANAPAAQLQKFLNLVVSTIYPIDRAITLSK